MAKNDTFDTEQLTDAAYYILLALTEERHGYAIMQYINELSDDLINIGPATLYTLLKKMNTNELIEQVGDTADRKKKYKLTENGLTLVKKEILRREKMVQHGLQIMNNLNREAR